MDKNAQLDLKLLPKELNLILYIMKVKNHLNEQVNTECIDWDLFEKLVIHHRIYPLIYKNIKDVRFIPLHVKEKLKKLYKRNTFQMLYLSAKMEEVNKVCIANDIPVLFLKGPVIASELYGNISLRTSADLDILIPINDLEKMENLLISTGYEKDDYIETVLSDWKWRHHHITFFHPLKKIKVEVHWRLNPGPGKEPRFKELWERKRISKEFTNSPIYFLGQEDLFLFLVMHGSRHGWSRLRWLIDIHQMLKQELNWETLNNLLKRFYSQHIAGQAIVLCNELLNAKVPASKFPSMNKKKSWRLAQEAIFYVERMVNLHNYPLPEEVHLHHKRHIVSLMSIHQKALFTMSSMYPYYTDAKTLPLPKKIHFLYFVLRPFLWIWRKTRNHAMS
ncbi:nucleotidyltransferase family protein [Mesobacillus foraminis]|uniref:nucleotidyltransferase domain-containing protein n=1 Tax=Mesobacillus foraminis TaxID=279826 RepID=UPI0039A36913